MKHIMNVVNQCEKPNCAFVGVGTWLSLASDFIGQETYQITPGLSFDSGNNGPRSGFEAIRVAGIPVFCDISCAKCGICRDYSSATEILDIHEKLSFANCTRSRHDGDGSARLHRRNLVKSGGNGQCEACPMCGHVTNPELTVLI